MALHAANRTIHRPYATSAIERYRHHAPITSRHPYLLCKSVYSDRNSNTLTTPARQHSGVHARARARAQKDAQTPVHPNRLSHPRPKFCAPTAFIAHCCKLRSFSACIVFSAFCCTYPVLSAPPLLYVILPVLVGARCCRRLLSSGLVVVSARFRRCSLLSVPVAVATCCCRSCCYRRPLLAPHFDAPAVLIGTSYFKCPLLSVSVIFSTRCCRHPLPLAPAVVGARRLRPLPFSLVEAWFQVCIETRYSLVWRGDARQ